MRLVAIEEHFRSPEVKASPAMREFERAAAAMREAGRAAGSAPDPRFAGVLAKLDDVGTERLADMDAGGVDFQVLSHAAPGVEALEGNVAVATAEAANDYLAGRVAANPDRFAGFAMLPMTAPESAAEELERTVTELGFRGALIKGQTDGRSSMTARSGRSSSRLTPSGSRCIADPRYGGMGLACRDGDARAPDGGWQGV